MTTPEPDLFWLNDSPSSYTTSTTTSTLSPLPFDYSYHHHNNVAHWQQHAALTISSKPAQMPISLALSASEYLLYPRDSTSMHSPPRLAMPAHHDFVIKTPETLQHSSVSSSNSIVLPWQESALTSTVVGMADADLTAQMVCFIMFQSVNVLYALEHYHNHHHHPSLLASSKLPNIHPTTSFLDFCRAVISTTRISSTVAMLGLSYIYRLKLHNPQLVATPGSEHRFFVVGLILANKFTDDNTYLNKTWAEVVKIPVAEINQMEREFLISLGWDLAVTLERFEAWQGVVDRFSMFQKDVSRLVSPMVPSSCRQQKAAVKVSPSPARPQKRTRTKASPATASILSSPPVILPVLKKCRGAGVQKTPLKRHTKSIQVSSSLPFPTTASLPPTLLMPNHKLSYLPITLPSVCPTFHGKYTLAMPLVGLQSCIDIPSSGVLGPSMRYATGGGGS